MVAFLPKNGREEVGVAGRRAPPPTGRSLGNYAIDYYALRMEEVVVVRVLHTARDAAALAGRGGFSSD